MRVKMNKSTAFINQMTAFARVAFLDTARRPGFLICSAFFIVLSCLSTVPFSPGIAADARHYTDAGVSTLYTGGCLSALIFVPLLLVPSKGRRASEVFFALSPGKNAVVTGLFTGFALALLIYFLLGGVFLSVVWEICVSRAAVRAGPLTGTVCAFFSCLPVCALVLMISRFFSYAPACVCAALVLVLGYASDFIPLPLALFTPAFSRLDPITLAGGSISSCVPAALHLLATVTLFLYLAGVGIGRREPL